MEKTEIPSNGVVDIDRLRAHVHCLGGDIGERNVFRPEALSAARDYIAETWTRQRYEISRQTYEAYGVQSSNLEITRSGKRWPDQFLLLGAHYDSARGAPGANDNGSGIAALLELSRLFRRQDPAVSVRFVAFVNEEPPFFLRPNQGSADYARAAKTRSDDIRLMIAIDCIGYYSDRRRSQHYPPPFGFFYPNEGNFLRALSNLVSRHELHRFADVFLSVSDFPLEFLATTSLNPGVSWSDHRGFWKNGYRALLVTDTAFYRYRHYHSARDTPDKLSYRQFTQVVQGLHDTFAELAASGEFAVRRNACRALRCVD